MKGKSILVSIPSEIRCMECIIDLPPLHSLHLDSQLQLIFFKCPTSESGLDQPSQKKCPTRVGQFAVVHCRALNR